MTNEEKQEIVNEVLAALQTHGKTIDQLTPVTSPSDSDAFELSGGRNLSYGKLKELITAIFTAALTGYVPADSLLDYIQQYIAKLGTNGALDWQESPIVMLATMGTSFDNVDGELPAYTLQEGDMYYQYGVNYQIFRKLAQGSEGMPAKADVVYFNMRTWRTYKWTGSTMVEIAKPKSRVVLADLHTQNYNSMATGTIAYNPIAKKIVEKVTSTSWSVSDPDPDYIYCDAQTNTSLRWDATNSAWVQIGGGSGGSVLKDVTFEDGNLIFTFETEQGEQEITVPIEFEASNYVPITRTVNGKALSQDITIGQSDISGLTAALAALVPQTRTINGKALSSNVTIGMSDIQGLVDAINNAGSGAVSVTTNQDGTFVIHVGSTDYTINLNHTHENMAKLIVCEESDLPSTLDPATIYAQVNDADNPTEIEVLYIAGLEFAGGGVPAGTPAITEPRGTSINLGENSGSGVSKAIEIRANSHITGDLTVALASNSDLSFDTTNLPSGVTYNSGAGTLTIEKNAAIIGVNITIVYSGSGAAEIDGGLIITGGGASPKSVVVVVEEERQPIGVKLTGTQWLQTDYCPNANTEFELRCKFTDKGNTSLNNGYFLTCANNSDTTEKFQIAFSQGKYQLWYTAKNSQYTLLNFSASADQANFVLDNSVLSFVKGASNGTFKFVPGGDESKAKSVQTTFMNYTMQNPLRIGRGNTYYFELFELTIYELTITENGSAVRHYVPKIVNGVVGLYDTVNNSFISSETAKTSGLATDELEAVYAQNNS